MKTLPKKENEAGSHAPPPCALGKDGIREEINSDAAAAPAFFRSHRSVGIRAARFQQKGFCPVWPWRKSVGTTAGNSRTNSSEPAAALEIPVGDDRCHDHRRKR